MMVGIEPTDGKPVCIKTDSGKYRIKVDYRSDSGDQSTPLIEYSSEFTIVDDTNNLNCADLQKEIAKDLEDLNYCQTKDDCVLTESLECFSLNSCGELINKNENNKFETIKNKINNHSNNTCNNCIRPLCTPSLIDCVQNKCVPVNTNTTTNSTNAQYKIIGSYTSPGESSFVEKIDNTVFLTDISEGLLAIDVSNPKEPKLLSKTKIGGGGAYALAMSPFGSMHALTSGYGNTKITLINISNSKKQNEVIINAGENLNTKRSVQDIVWIAGDYFYLAIDGPEVEILHTNRYIPLDTFSNWKEFESLGIFKIVENSHAIGIAASNGKLVIAQGETGIGVYGLENPTLPKLITNISGIGYINTVVANGNYIYAGTSDEIKIIDLTTQKVVSKIPANAWRLKVKDNLLYIAEGEKGVTIVNVSDPTKPQTITTINTPGRARDITIDGDYIYVADDRDDLQVIQKF